MEQKRQFHVTAKEPEGSLMDRITRCLKCGKLMVPVATMSGRTDLQCISCDDPAVKWAESPPAAAETPDVAEPAAHHWKRGGASMLHANPNRPWPDLGLW